jgi:hypothetical protein
LKSERGMRARERERENKEMMIRTCSESILLWKQMRGRIVSVYLSYIVSACSSELEIDYFILHIIEQSFHCRVYSITFLKTASELALRMSY